MGLKIQSVGKVTLLSTTLRFKVSTELNWIEARPQGSEKSFSYLSETSTNWFFKNPGEAGPGTQAILGGNPNGQ